MHLFERASVLLCKKKNFKIQESTPNFLTPITKPRSTMHVSLQKMEHTLTARQFHAVRALLLFYFVSFTLDHECFSIVYRYTRILVIISHSQDFLNGVCTNIMHMQLNKLKYYGVSKLLLFFEGNSMDEIKMQLVQKYLWGLYYIQISRMLCVFLLEALKDFKHLLLSLSRHDAAGQ